MPRLFLILLGLPALLSAAELSERAYQILQENCFACHGAAMQMSGLDLRTREKAVLGGERGPAVSPTSLSLSLAWGFVTHAAKPTMPPGGKLSDQDIETLRKWIVAGAPFPETAVSDEEAERLAALKNLEERPITDDERQWWAFQPPVRRDPPPQATTPGRRVPAGEAQRRRPATHTAGRQAHAYSTRLSRPDRAAPCSRTGRGVHCR